MAAVEAPIFLVDCGPGAGLGHLRRMLVLAQTLRRRGRQSRFILADLSFSSFVAEKGFVAEQWDGNAARLPYTGLAIIDGYHFDCGLPSRWQQETGATVAVFDDNADRPLEADIIVNQNLRRLVTDYFGYRARKILVGPQFAVIDPGFAHLAGKPRPLPHRILISFGGTDEGQYCIPVLDTLLANSIDSVIDLVVVSAVLPERLVRLKERFSDRLTIHRNASMIERMAEAQLYIGAAGMTAVEAVGSGMDIVACAIVPNQRINVSALASFGFPYFDTFQPLAMAQAALDQLRGSDRPHNPPVIDGRGAERVADEICQLVTPGDIDCGRTAAQR